MGTDVSERRLVDVLISWLRKRHSVAREVPHFEKRIDLALCEDESGEVWAIEAKTKNWPQAVAQAVVNLAPANRSYIAVYSENIHRVCRKTLAEHGIGLISVGTRWGDVTIVRKADPSPYHNQYSGERLRNHIVNGGP